MRGAAVPPLALIPTAWLEWIDAHPWIYTSTAWLGWTALAAMVGAALWHDWFEPARPHWRVPRWVLRPGWFVVIAAGAMVFCRWPVCFEGRMQNPDETQLGAAALTYWYRDPVPWRDVDMHTSGPLNAYILWPALILRGRMDYCSLRITALALHLLLALAVYGAIRRFASEGIARLAALPLITYLAFTSFWDFVQYSSEQFSIAALSVAVWLLASAVGRNGLPEKSRLGRLALAGILLGSIPWGKPQVVPLGAVVGLAGLAAIWHLTRGRERVRQLASLGGGALLPSLGFACVLTIYGLWAQFRVAYIESNQLYTAGVDEARSTLFHGFAQQCVALVPALDILYWGTLAVAAGVALGAGVVHLRPRSLLALAWVMLVVAAWAATYPGRAFTHYFQLILAPLGWLGGLSLVAAVRAGDATVGNAWRTPVRVGIAAVFCCATVPRLIYTRMHEPPPVVGTLAAERAKYILPVSARLNELKKPGDALIVWGWMPRLNTETSLPQGNREGHSAHEVDGSPMQPFYRARFMRDLVRHPPAFVVDAVCPGSQMYESRETTGTQTFPEFHQFLLTHYLPPENVDGFLIYIWPGH